jgi:hypothetical protein
MFAAIAERHRILVLTRVSKVVQPVFAAADQVVSDAVVVFNYDDAGHFGILSSSFHWWWAVTYASTMRTDLRYTPSDCFDTFPQPMVTRAITAAGKALDAHRAKMMIVNGEGLTRTYNRVRDPNDHRSDVETLRRLHVELDYALADAYGWADLDLDHGFHETSQGARYTIGPATRTEVLDRLLELNHQRHAAEQAATPARLARAKKAAKKAASPLPGTVSLFDRNR